MYRTIDISTYDPQDVFGRALLGNECWTWMGSKYQNGYGKLGRAGIMAHRIAYELTEGAVPVDMAWTTYVGNEIASIPITSK